MRDRSAVVIIENHKVLLIKRIRDGSTYYVFPGGGIENGETPQFAAQREALEELGVEVEVGALFAEVPFNGTQYYFLADIISGEIGSGQGEEYMDKNRNLGVYVPTWIAVDKLSSLDVRPQEVVERIQNYEEEIHVS